MGQRRFKNILLLCLIITLAINLTEGKRSLSGRSRTSSSSSRGGSTRRTQSQTHYSPPPSTSINKPTYHAPNSENVKLTYGGVHSQPPQSSQSKPIGWNVPPQKPPINAGPPPAYSPHNVPGGAKTNIHEPPPVYKPPNNAAPPAYPGNNQQHGSYPKQVYNTNSQSSGGYPHNTAAGAGTAGRATHNTGYRPHNGTGGYSGVHSPIYAQTVRPVAAGPGTYHQQGSIQPGYYPHQTSGFPSGNYPQMPHGGFPPGVQPVGGGHFIPPQQSAPVFQGTGIQPGFYPAGTFPQKSSGPGIGTGLIVGALGGALLGHALTPTHHVVAGAGGSHTDSNQDRIIVINNNPGQPATVTNAAGQPASGVNVIQNGVQQPSMAGNPEAPVPLASFPSQQQAQPGQQTYQPGAPINPGVGAGAATANANAAGSTGTYPEGTVPLAPFPNSNTNSTEQSADQTNPNATQPQLGTYCVPVLVNLTDPNNTANVTTVEQVYCYQVAMPPPEQQMAPVQNSNGSQQQQPDLMHMPGNYNPQSNDMSNIPTQKTSTASLAANSNIKSGSKSIISGSKSILDTILMTMIAFSISYAIH